MNNWQSARLRITALSRWKQVLLALVTIAMVWWVVNTLIVRFPIRSHTMNEYTQNMQPVCVGRYLIDVPSQFKLASMGQSVNGIEIVRLPKDIPNLRVFMFEMERAERQLREMLAKEDYSGIDQVLPISENSKAFIYYRGSVEKKLARIEAYFLKDQSIYQFKTDVSTERIAEKLKSINALAALISLRTPSQTPTTPGLCIDGGFISGKEFEDEGVSAGFSLIGYPSVGFTIAIEQSGTPDEWLNARIDRNWSHAAYAKVTGALTTHRKAKLNILGQEGEERIFSGTEKGQHSWTAVAEIYGDNSVSKQTYKLDMDNDSHDSGTNEAFTTTFPNDTALSIWDAVTKTIRLRPGAI